MNEPWPGTPWTPASPGPAAPAFDTGSLAPFYRRRDRRDQERRPREAALVRAQRALQLRCRHGRHGARGPLSRIQLPRLLRTRLIHGHRPNNLACAELDEHVLSNADAHAQATGDALMLSEFGATDDLATIGQNVQQADQHMVSWEYWHYCECLDPTTTGSGTQAIVIDPNQPPSGPTSSRRSSMCSPSLTRRSSPARPRTYGFDDRDSHLHPRLFDQGPRWQELRSSPQAQGQELKVEVPPDPGLPRPGPLPGRATPPR